MGKGGIDLGRFTSPEAAGDDAPPPPRFDPAAARREAEAAQRPGALSTGLQSSTQLLAVTNGALGKLGRKHLPVAVLEEWQASLPTKAAPGGAPGLARDLDAALLPLLDGARGELTRAATAQRAAEDQQAAVGWMNQGARLAAVAPAVLARQVVARLGASDPTLGKLFQDKVAYHQVLRDLERDAGLDLAADPRLAGVAPEVLADLTAERGRLARAQDERRAAQEAVRRVEVSRAVARTVTEAGRGVAGAPLTRAALLERHGLSAGARLWELWQAGQTKVPAYVLVRGKSPEEIAAAKAGYVGDPAVLARVEQEDAAERRRDPAGYGLSWAKGYRAAYDGSTDPAERAALLWDAQGAAGIPESERSPWTAEEGWALGERWQAAGEGGPPHQVALARVALLRETLMSLPPEQRAAAVAQLERLGLDGEAPGQIRAIAAALEDNRPGAAYAAAGPDYRPVAVPGSATPVEASPEQQGADRPAEAGASAAAVFVNPPGLGRAQGLPDASGGSWQDAAYDPVRQNHLEGLLASILSLPENPRARERVLKSIGQVFAEDPRTAAQLTDWAYTIASAGDDAPVGPLESARAGVNAMYQRVQKGAPYDATWAAARDELAALEEATGRRFLPSAPGTVAVLDGAGRMLLELPLAGLGELGETKFRQFLDDIESALSGDLSPEELATLASRYDEADLRGPTGELPEAALIEGDHGAAQAVLDAHAAALAHPNQWAEIARDLLQVLIEQDSDLDLEQLALETALEFLPGKGLYDLGVDAVEMVRAIGEGDWAAVATIGGVALLDAIGSVPGIGPLAKRGLERIAKGLRLIKTAGQEAAERIAKIARGGSKETNALENAGRKESGTEVGASEQGAAKSTETPATGNGEVPQGATRSPSHAEAAQLAKDAENYLVDTYGRGGSLSNPDYLDAFLTKMNLPANQRERLVRIFSRDIIPQAAEREVGAALATFAEGSGFRIWGGKKSIRARLTDGNSFPDIALKPVDMSDEEFGVFVKDAVANIDRRSFAIVEVKTGTAGLKPRQRELLEKLIAEGKGDIFVLYNLPQSKIRPEFLASSVEEVLTRQIGKISEEERELVLRLSKEIQKSLPQKSSAGEAFLLILLATSSVLGLKYTVGDSEEG